MLVSLIVVNKKLGVWLLLLADWHQTTRIVADGAETNPVIGRHGEHVSPSLYFAGCLLACAFALTMLPRPAARGLAFAIVLVELYVVHINLTCGYGC